MSYQSSPTSQPLQQITKRNVLYHKELVLLQSATTNQGHNILVCTQQLHLLYLPQELFFLFFARII